MNDEKAAPAATSTKTTAVMSPVDSAIRDSSRSEIILKTPTSRMTA